MEDVLDLLFFDNFSKKAEEVEDPQKAAEVIQEYEGIIRTNKKGVIRIAYHQGKVFKKFKYKEKFITLVNKLGINKTNMIFKIIFLCEGQSNMLKSSIGLVFFKTHDKDIPEICNKNELEFP